MGLLLFDEVRLTRDALRYGYAVGKVRVLQSRVLDRSAFERLVDAPTFAEQKRLLSETVYGRYLEGATSAEQVEAGLATALEDFYGFLPEAGLPDAVPAFFRTRYDYLNLKAALKARLLDAPLHGLLVEHGSVPSSAFEGDMSELPAPLASIAQKVLALVEPPAAEEPADDSEALAAHDVRQPAVDASVIDAAVDRAMFDELLRLARASRSRFLVELARSAVDIANAKTLVRASLARRGPEATVDMLIGGGAVPTAQFAELVGFPPVELASALARMPQLKGVSAGEIETAGRLDVELDAITAAALRRGRMADVGSEPVIAYVMTREAEVAAVRTVLLGRLSGLDNETLRSRLRASYS